MIFWAITQQAVAIPYWHFGKPVSLIFKGVTPWPLKRGLISCPQTSVRNYHCLLHNNPEECRFHLLLDISLKSQDWKLSHVQINMVFATSGTLWKDWVHTSQRKQFALIRQNNLQLCTQTVAAHYNNYMVHINTQHGKNAELLNDKPGGTLGFRRLIQDITKYCSS